MFVTIVNRVVAFLSLFVDLRSIAKGIEKRLGIVVMRRDRYQQTLERLQLAGIESDGNDLVLIATSGPKSRPRIRPPIPLTRAVPRYPSGERSSHRLYSAPGDWENCQQVA